MAESTRSAKRSMLPMRKSSLDRDWLQTTQSRNSASFKYSPDTSHPGKRLDGKWSHQHALYYHISSRLGQSIARPISYAVPYRPDNCKSSIRCLRPKADVTTHSFSRAQRTKRLSQFPFLRRLHGKNFEKSDIISIENQHCSEPVLNARHQNMQIES